MRGLTGVGLINGRSDRRRYHVTFNHGVEGSSPSALTNEIGHFLHFHPSPLTACVGMVLANQLPITMGMKR